jgi:hypothetical protein
MRITVSCRSERNGVIWDEYAIGEDGKPLGFPSVREAVNFLADRNWTLADLRELNFNYEKRRNE